MYCDYYNISPSEFLIDNRDEFDNNVRYDLSSSKVCLCCPECGSVNFKKHGILHRKARDLSEYGKMVGLSIKAQRYICNDCSATWCDSFETIDDNAKMTKRMRAFIQQKALSEPFSHISEELSISESTVRRIFIAYAREMDSKHVPVAPKILGMDENYLNGTYRALYVDIEQTRVIDMTANRKLKTVQNWLSRLSQKANIQCVTIDMWGSYKEAVKAELPDVPIVIDKFHVIKHVTGALDKIRKRLRAGLSAKEQKHIKNNRWLLLRNEEELDKSGKGRLRDLLCGFPQFEEPYKLKERFRKIYQADNKRAAEALFEEWKNDAEKYPEYMEVVTMVHDWKHEIFNYFDYKYTNAATESLNHLAKEIAAKGRGYSYEVLRMKILYGTKLEKPSKYRYYQDNNHE